MPDKITAYTRLVLSILVTVGFFGVVWAVIYYTIKPEIKDIVLLLIGALIGCLKDVTNFSFLSSASSATKDQTITNLAKAVPPNAG